MLSEEKVVNANFTKWFNYAVNFMKECDSTAKFNRQCAENVMRDLNINADDVQDCFDKSFERRGNKKSDNRILKEDKDWAKKMGIVLHPAISINNITYRGDINGFDIFKAICAGFKDQPDICKGDNVFAVIEESESYFHRPHNVAQFMHVVGAIILVVFFNLCLLWAYRRYSKKRMNEHLQVQVNSAVSQYFKLSG